MNFYIFICKITKAPPVEDYPYIVIEWRPESNRFQNSRIFSHSHTRECRDVVNYWLFLSKRSTKSFSQPKQVFCFIKISNDFKHFLSSRANSFKISTVP